jgi:hypothetical protein
MNLRRLVFTLSTAALFAACACALQTNTGRELVGGTSSFLRSFARGAGTRVSLRPLPTDDATVHALEAERAASRSITTADLESKYALPFRDALPYDPAAAKGRVEIEQKGFPLTPEDEKRLARDGFALASGIHYQTFAYAYADAFRKHLPVYISADAILFAVHKSFDALLKEGEMRVLVPALQTLVDRARDALREGWLRTADAEAADDVDDYLAVAASLLDGETVIAPIASGNAAQVESIVSKAKAAAGAEPVVLFGVRRTIDFSQFTPRGHYEGIPALERYFRAMVWLSRTDFRIVEVAEGKQTFRRRQLAAALALRSLLDRDARAAWARLDRSAEALVGERDEMNVTDADRLQKELGVSSLADLDKKTDEEILATLARTGLGQQRIASQVMTAGPDETPLLHTSFSLLNQRYTVDSHVLSNVANERVRTSKPPRLMPSPLDVAFAALGNDGAAELLRGELDRHDYAPTLHMSRVLVDLQRDEFWQESLYTTWESALRSMSPRVEDFRPASEGGLPSVATTHAWDLRVLRTQLASWAELRHDTTLYSKQSYSMSPLCEFPDAYVDPYPDVFRRIAAHAHLGEALARDTFSPDPALAERARRYFARLAEVATRLATMAEEERAGKTLTPEDMSFVNTMVSMQPSRGCGGPPSFSGWYGDLFVDRGDLATFGPVITDVHTQPSDENGAFVGRVLHVGTGAVDGILVTIDSCDGARAYAGYVSSYYEVTTQNLERLTDTAWAQKLQTAPAPAQPAWLTPILP